jgi:hypothetical protein
MRRETAPPGSVCERSTRHQQWDGERSRLWRCAGRQPSTGSVNSGMETVPWAGQNPGQNGCNLFEFMETVEMRTEEMLHFPSVSAGFQRGRPSFPSWMSRQDNALGFSLDSAVSQVIATITDELSLRGGTILGTEFGEV